MLLRGSSSFGCVIATTSILQRQGWAGVLSGGRGGAFSGAGALASIGFVEKNQGVVVEVRRDPLYGRTGLLVPWFIFLSVAVRIAARRAAIIIAVLLLPAAESLLQLRLEKICRFEHAQPPPRFRGKGGAGGFADARRPVQLIVQQLPGLHLVCDRVPRELPVQR